jgi:cephalosporin hydroxylase
MKILERENIENILSRTHCDLGENGWRLFEILKSHSNLTCVDLGVRHGSSSAILSYRSEEKNNKIFGCDIAYDVFDSDYDLGPNYYRIAADSVTLGKTWENGPVDLVFVDTLHVREQVLAELYFWSNHLKSNGLFVFHDTEWEDGVCEVHNGMKTKTVNHAVMDFFNLDKLEGEYVDDNIHVKHFKESYGMTFIQVKNVEYLQECKNNVDWKEVFEVRNFLTDLYLNPSSHHYCSQVESNCLNEMVIEV